MRRRRFLTLVREAIAALPPPVRAHMANVAVFVRDVPTAEECRAHGAAEDDLLGLYEGTPRTEQAMGPLVPLPDRITLFQRPIEECAGAEEEVREEIRRTLWHEVAHHFGWDDAELHRLEADRGWRDDDGV